MRTTYFWSKSCWDREYESILFIVRRPILLGSGFHIAWFYWKLKLDSRNGKFIPLNTLLSIGCIKNHQKISHVVYYFLSIFLDLNFDKVHLRCYSTVYVYVVWIYYTTISRPILLIQRVVISKESLFYFRINKAKEVNNFEFLNSFQFCIALMSLFNNYVLWNNTIIICYCLTTSKIE